MRRGEFRSEDIGKITAVTHHDLQIVSQHASCQKLEQHLKVCYLAYS